MPGGRLRMEKLAALLQTGRLDTLPLITHRFHGFEHMEEALLLMKNKPRRPHQAGRDPRLSDLKGLKK